MRGDYKFLCTYDEPPVKNLNFYLLFLRSSWIWRHTKLSVHETGKQYTNAKLEIKNVAEFIKITVDEKIEIALNITIVLWSTLVLE